MRSNYYPSLQNIDDENKNKIGINFYPDIDFQVQLSWHSKV